MDLTSAQARLNKAYKHLRLRWEETRHTWRDTTAANFERDHLDPLEPRILAALSALERLGGILQQARRDCS